MTYSVGSNDCESGALETWLPWTTGSLTLITSNVMATQTIVLMQLAAAAAAAATATVRCSFPDAA